MPHTGSIAAGAPDGSGFGAWQQECGAEWVMSSRLTQQHFDHYTLRVVALPARRFD